MSGCKKREREDAIVIFTLIFTHILTTTYCHHLYNKGGGGGGGVVVGSTQSLIALKTKQKKRTE